MPHLLIIYRILNRFTETIYNSYRQGMAAITSRNTNQAVISALDLKEMLECPVREEILKKLINKRLDGTWFNIVHILFLTHFIIYTIIQVCLRMPRNPPVYQCDRGHMLCNECHGKLTNCPVCRLPLGKTRSLITEKVLIN